MSTRKTTFFYAALLAVVSVAIGMVIASRLDMAPRSEAQALTAPPPMNSAPLSGPVDAATFRTIAHDQSPMVVSISTTTTRPEQTADDQSDELFRRFFGAPRQAPNEPQESSGAGTGFIIDKGAGLILTNNHVVENATRIRVTLYGEDKNDDDGHEAKVVGRDPLTDSALIELVDKLVLKSMQEARFGDSLPTLHLKPSEYWARQCHLGSSFIRRPEVEQRDGVGVDRIMWGSDFPHEEGTFPHTTEALAHAFTGVDRSEVERMVGLTAVDVYGFDLDVLRPVADRIGPPVDAVAGGLDRVPEGTTSFAFGERSVGVA